MINKEYFRVLVVVKTPMQMLNALEYLYKMNIKTEDVDLFNANDHQQFSKIIQKIAGKHQWKRTFHHTMLGNRWAISRLISALITRCLVFFYFRINYDYVIVGHYSQSIQRFFLRKKYGKKVLVDDGIQTLNIKEIRKNEIENNIIEDYNPTRLNRMINRVWGFDKKIIQSIVVFTSFNIEPYKIDTLNRNNFDLIKDGLDNFKEDNSILFVGSDISEIGGLDEQTYIASVKKVKSHYAPMKMYYCPKKTENAEKLLKISSFVEIIKINYPVELLPVIDGFKPKVFASLYSSAIFNFANMFGNSCEYTLMDIRKSLKIDPKYDFVIKAYQYREQMTNNKINIISI